MCMIISKTLFLQQIVCNGTVINIFIIGYPKTAFNTIQTRIIQKIHQENVKNTNSKEIKTKNN